MSNLPYSHYISEPLTSKLAFDENRHLMTGRLGTATYDQATEAGRIPAAALLGLLGAGVGVTGASLLSDEENKNKNMLLAGLLGGIGGAAGGYYGADLPTGVSRNSAVDPTFGGQNLPGWLNNLLSFDRDKSLNLGQLTTGSISYGDDKIRDLIRSIQN